VISFSSFCSSSVPVISLPSGRTDDARFDRAADQPGLELALVADERLGAAALGAEERRLRDVDVAESTSARICR
jgi:hypothetical protein